MYSGIISYIDGKVEEIQIEANDYLEAMRLFHKICNARINIAHKIIKQTLLAERN